MALILLLREGIEVLGQWDLTKLPEIITVGSDNSDTIRLTGENIFPCHLKIEQSEKDRLVITDERDNSLKDISGTFLNGKCIRQTETLQIGDRISFSIYCIEVHDTTKTEEKEHEKSSYLLSIYGPYLGYRYILDEDEVRLGRDQEFNDILLRYVNPGAKNKKIDMSISRRLLSFKKQEKDYSISKFKESHTEVRLNNEKLNTDEEYPLMHGDEIEILSSNRSTIYRFVHGENLNFKKPKKAGDFFIRNAQGLVFMLMFLIIIVCGVFFYNTFNKRSVVAEKIPPGQMIQESESNHLWFSGDMINSAKIDSTLDFDMTPSPAIGDINGDDHIDLVIIDKSGYVSTYDCVTKRPLWEPSLSFKAQHPFSIVLKDLNDDKVEDILYVTDDSRLCVLDGQSGFPISKWNTHIGGILASAPVVYDIDGNDLLDVVLVSEAGYIHIGYNRIVQVEWKQLFLEHEVASPPIFIDFPLGKVLLFMGSNDGKIITVDIINDEMDDFTFDVNESLNQALGRYGERNNIASPLVGGSISESLNIVACVTRQSRVIAFDLDAKERRWYDADIITTGLIPRHTSGPVMVDMDEDGHLDILVVFPSGTIKLYKGNIVGDPTEPNECIWIFDLDNTDRFVAPPAFGDLNKDGVPEIVIGGDSGKLYIIDGYSGELLWQKQISEDPIRSSALIGDVDGDTYVELFCMNVFNDVFKIKTNTKVFKNQILWKQIFGVATKNCVITSSMPELSNYNLLLFVLALICLMVIAGGFLFQKGHNRKVQRTFKTYIVQ